MLPSAFQQQRLSVASRDADTTTGDVEIVTWDVLRGFVWFHSMAADGRGRCGRTLGVCVRRSKFRGLVWAVKVRGVLSRRES